MLSYINRIDRYSRRDARPQRTCTDNRTFRETMKEEIKIVGNRELEKARIALKEEAVKLSLNVAEHLLRNNISDFDQERLAKEYIQKMGGLH